MAEDKVNNGSDHEFAKNSFNRRREHMKELLDLVKFGVAKNEEDFLFYKRKIMDFFYGDMEDDFNELVDAGVLERCECRSSLRQGWSECPHCSGAGFKAKEE